MGNGNLGPFENEAHPTGLVFFCVIHMSFLFWNILGWFRILLSIYVHFQALLITGLSHHFPGILGARMRNTLGQFLGFPLVGWVSAGRICLIIY